LVFNYLPPRKATNVACYFTGTKQLKKYMLHTEKEKEIIEKFKLVQYSHTKDRKHLTDEFTDEEIVIIYKWGHLEDLNTGFKNKDKDRLLDTLFLIATEQTEKGSYRKILKTPSLLDNVQNELFTYFCSEYLKQF
jgi:hypothetical protein